MRQLVLCLFFWLFRAGQQHQLEPAKMEVRAEPVSESLNITVAKPVAAIRFVRGTVAQKTMDQQLQQNEASARQTERQECKAGGW